MHFSVVMPLYNKESFVRRSILSVLRQTVADLELIIVDDGSDDRSLSVVKEIEDNRIRIVSQANSGAAAARNRGIAESTGSMIAFLDADDTWESTFLETIDRLTRHYPNAGFYATAYRLVEPDGLIHTPSFGVPAGFEGYVRSYFRAAAQGRAPANSSAIAVSRSIFSMIGMFDTQMVTGEDNDMWARIALSLPVVFTTQVESTYHQDAAPEQRLANVGTKSEHYQPSMHIKALLHRINNQSLPATLQADVRYYVAKRLFRAARTLLLDGKPDSALETLSWLDSSGDRNLLASRWALRIAARGFPHALLASCRHAYRLLRARGIA